MLEATVVFEAVAGKGKVPAPALPLLPRLVADTVQ
jgi:hypothetical protein